MMQMGEYHGMIEESAIGDVSSMKEKIPVLLLEDDLPTQHFMKIVLGERYDVIAAVSAEEARVLLNQHRVSIILMDISLRGEENGLEFTRWLRGQDAWKAIPVIAVTAHAFDSDRKNALAAGCDAYFAKPIKRAKLLETMDVLLH